MKIRDLLLGPNGLLKPQVQESKFPRIHYASLSEALNLPYGLEYSAEADARIEAYFIPDTGGSVICEDKFIWRGQVVYLLDGEPAAFSWKNCFQCPTQVRFFSPSQAHGIKTVILNALKDEPPKFVSLDDEFIPYQAVDSEV
jgi:hypothetical protein